MPHLDDSVGSPAHIFNISLADSDDVHNPPIASAPASGSSASATKASQNPTAGPSSSSSSSSHIIPTPSSSSSSAMQTSHSHSSSATLDADDAAYLAETRARFIEAGAERFRQILQQEGAALVLKCANYDRARKARLFEEFKAQMREFARLQSEEVEVRVEEERKVMLGVKSLTTEASPVHGEAGPSKIQASMSIDEAMLMEQRRLWDAFHRDHDHPKQKPAAQASSATAVSSTPAAAASSSSLSSRRATVQDADEDGSSTEEEALTDRPSRSSNGTLPGSSGKFNFPFYFFPLAVVKRVMCFMFNGSSILFCLLILVRMGHMVISASGLIPPMVWPLYVFALYIRVGTSSGYVVFRLWSLTIPPSQSMFNVSMFAIDAELYAARDLLGNADDHVLTHETIFLT